MWLLLVGLLLGAAGHAVAAQPADCPTASPTGQALPLALDLAGRPGVPNGVTGQSFVAVPLSPPGMACADDAARPPHDVLRGEPGDVLGGPPSPDLLRGPGTPHVWVETR
jgi:hypothetical protein